MNFWIAKTCTITGFYFNITHVQIILKYHHCSSVPFLSDKEMFTVKDIVKYIDVTVLASEASRFFLVNFF